MTFHPGTIATATPQRAALVIEGEVLTYGTLATRAERLAGRLAALGCRAGDTVALILGNSPEFFVAAWAAQMSGLYFVPLSERLALPERDHILTDSGAKVVLTHDRSFPSALVPSEWEEGGVDPFARIEGSDMLYTSGTTGRPKGVKRPLTGVPFGSDARRVARAKELFGIGGRSVFLSPAPLYHAAPLRWAMLVQRLGGTVVAMKRFDAEGALELIAAHGVTHSQWVPTMFSRMLALDQRPPNPPAHVCAIHAGAPCPPLIKRRMIKWWGQILHEYYSGTEAVGFTHITSAEWLARPGSVGRAYGSTIHILDKHDRLLPTGRTGRVFFESTTAHAYHNDPDKTAAATSRQGYATMGDIGHVDAEGYLYLTDRASFTINSGGANIYPAEVEAAMLGDPGIVDCAVFGVPDADMGEVVQAIVELREPPTDPTTTALAIGDKLGGLLAANKIPRQVAFVARVRRMESGKIKKRELVKDYADPQRRGFSLRAK